MNEQITLNDRVRMKLTDTGRRQLTAAADAFNDRMRASHPNVLHRASAPKEDADGCVTGQLWCLIQDMDLSSMLGREMPFSWIEKVKP